MNVKRRLFLAVSLLLTATLACGETAEITGVRRGVERGWLCDWDKRGEVILWSKPAPAFQDNFIVAVVRMPVKGCVDVALLDEATTDGIFYKVGVAADVGWVDVDYFYPASVGKPIWVKVVPVSPWIIPVPDSQ